MLKNFFYNFLPNVVAAETDLHQLFEESQSGHVAARFNFTFKLKDDEVGRGEYMDEFVFSENSNKLTAVYMFENLNYLNF